MEGKREGDSARLSRSIDRISSDAIDSTSPGLTRCLGAECGSDLMRGRGRRLRGVPDAGPREIRLGQPSGLA
jgi:hypothetical protein